MTVETGSILYVFSSEDVKSYRVNARGQMRPRVYKKLNVSAKMAVISSRKREGDVIRVANKTFYSPSYVSQVLRGERSNMRIVNAAYDLSRGRVKNSQK